jgi:DNA-binding GntR family transcriptional regulator
MPSRSRSDWADAVLLPSRPSDMRLFLGSRRRDKASGAVVDYVLSLLFEGAITAGDRLDRFEIAAALGVSRTPVQEALVMLERDGLIVSDFHRGSFVARFDALAVREHVRMYGLITEDMIAREAARSTPELSAGLTGVVVTMAGARHFHEWDTAGRDFMRLIARAHAQPRTRALLTSFASFMPWTAMLTWPKAAEETIDCFVAIARAFEARDSGAAAAAMHQNLQTIADLLVEELTCRGLFGREPS